MDLDEAATELYGVALDDFMATRTRLVAQARAAKDRPLATAIAALKKPTRSAWLLNLLSRRSSDVLAELGELAGRLAAAHRAGDLAALRALGTERTALVGRLSAAAVNAAAHGYRATEAVKGEVSDTLSAAIADPEVRSELLAGRLVKAHVYSGFGLPTMPVLAPGLAPSEPRSADELAPPAAGQIGPEDVARRAAEGVDRHAAEDVVRHAAEDAERHVAEDVDRRAAEAAREQAERLVAEASDDLRRARAGYQLAAEREVEARERLDRASQEVADLRAELRAAEDAEVAVRRAATDAADGVHEARGAVQQAEQALAEASRRLAAGER